MSVSQPLIQTGLLGEAIDRAPALVLVVDEELRYVAVNRYACDVLGYTREELLGLRVTDVARATETAADYAALVRGGERTGRATLSRKDGAEVTVDYRARQTTIAGMIFYASVAFVCGSPA